MKSFQHRDKKLPNHGIPTPDLEQFFSSGASHAFEALYRQVNSQALAPYFKTCLETDGLILDAGCGWGDLAENLNMESTCCIDLAFEQLRQGRHRGVIGPCVQSNLTRLPFEEDTFDTVLCANVLHYTGFPGFEELYRVTKPNGRMLLAFLERSDYTRRSIELAMAWGMFPSMMGNAPLFDIAVFLKVQRDHRRQRHRRMPASMVQGIPNRVTQRIGGVRAPKDPPVSLASSPASVRLRRVNFGFRALSIESLGSSQRMAVSFFPQLLGQDTRAIV